MRRGKFGRGSKGKKSYSRGNTIRLFRGGYKLT